MDHRTNRVFKSLAGVTPALSCCDSARRLNIYDVLTPHPSRKHLPWGKAECTSMHAAIVRLLLYEDYVWVSLGNAMKAKQETANTPGTAEYGQGGLLRLDGLQDRDPVTN